ncbi:MAG: hypothetical protein LBS27_04775 [Bifidobacteriaceae bacterium]|nr:hypothetical protein [Bifidobacteriaceae bacterium]
MATTAAWRAAQPDATLGRLAGPATRSVVNYHAPTVLTPGSGTLTSGNAEGKGCFGLGNRFCSPVS